MNKRFRILPNRRLGTVFFALGVASALLLPAETLASTAHGTNLSRSVQQVGTVTGHIVDENGEPLIGVTVRTSDGATGTVTDIDGNFSLNVPSGTSLKLSYTGYKDKTVTSGGTISLEPDVLGLDDVVVIGYGTQKRRDLTGAITTVKNDVIKLTPSSNPMESLQGRVPGLDITKSSGQAGTGVELQLRGNRSISASGSPLFLIDGMPGNYSTLNPNDIESIEVLKDASSTAVYGSSGANGVVIITTKGAKEGTMKVNFDAYYGYNGWSTLPTMNSADQYVHTVLLARQQAGEVATEDDVLDAAMLEAYKKGQVVDWTDALIGHGSVQNYSISFSGGTKKTKAYFSVNYSDEKGEYKNDEYKLFSSRARIDHIVNKWLTAGFNMQASYRKSERTYSKLYNALVAAPFGSLYNEDGTINPYPIIGNNKQVNLLLSQDRDRYRNSSNGTQLYIQPYVKITPLKGLTWESRVSAALGYSNGHTFIGYGSYQFYDQLGTGALNATKEQQAAVVKGTTNNSHSWGWTWENIVTYNFTLNKVHDFTLTGVTTYNHNRTETSGNSATGITDNSYLWTNLGAAIGVKEANTGYSMSRGMGLVARLNYSYLGRYLFAASVRHDASSRLAKGHRWSTFPAVSAGWRISDEQFMESTRSWLDNLKIRVGYGETGAAGINPYDSWSILQQGNLRLAGEALTKYFYPKIVSNPELTWERSHNFNVGLDATFLNNRIDFTSDFYVTNTTGVIWEQSLPITSGGFDAKNNYTTKVNLARTKNVGVEFNLTTRNIMTKDFDWTTVTSVSHNHEEVSSLGSSSSQNYVTSGDYTLHIGDPVRSYYAYKITGVWQKGEEKDAAVFGRQPGDLKVDIPGMVRDSEGRWHKTILDEDGQEVTTEYDADNQYAIGNNDRQIIGHQSPDWSIGFHNTLRYKDFDLSFYMYWRLGQMINYQMLTSYSSNGGAFPAYFDYWTTDNPSNDFPALNSQREIKEFQEWSSRAYVDGSFFKIKNITLGYTLPRRLCNKIGIASLRVYSTITNPYVHAMSHLIKDYDPEMGGDIDFPLTRQLVFGLSLSF
jgi:TonB-linked SusC/RagA family outer membrane protein